MKGSNYFYKLRYEEYLELTSYLIYRMLCFDLDYTLSLSKVTNGQILSTT